MNRPGLLGRLRHPRRPSLSVIIPLGPGSLTTLPGAASSGPSALAPEDLRRSVNSVLEQSLTDLEVLIVTALFASPEESSDPAYRQAARIGESDSRVRVLTMSPANAVRAARAPVITLLDPHDTVASGAYEFMLASMKSSGAHGVIGAAGVPQSGGGTAVHHVGARSTALLDALETSVAGRLAARAELWRSASTKRSPEAIALAAVLSARSVSILDRVVVSRAACEGADDALVALSMARAADLMEATADAPRARSRLLGGWMRRELLDLVLRSECRPPEYVDLLRSSAAAHLPAAGDEAWMRLPLLDRVLLWTAIHGSRADFEELLVSRAEETAVCPIRLVGDLDAPLRAEPPVLTRIASPPAELISVRPVDLRLVVTAAVSWRQPGLLEVEGVAYVRGLATRDAGKLRIEAVDEAGETLAEGQVRNTPAPDADLEADDPWCSHTDAGFIAVLELDERYDGARLRASLTVVDRRTTAWLPAIPAASAPSEDDGEETGEVTVDSACLEDGLLTLEGRAPRLPEAMTVFARSPQESVELATRTVPGGWRATIDLFGTTMQSGDYALTWSAGPDHHGPCAAGVFLATTPVELAGQVRSVRLHNQAGGGMTMTIMAPLTPFERSRYGRAQLVSRDPGPLERAIAFETFGDCSTGDDPAAVLADLRAHGTDVPMWWTVADGTVSAPSGAAPVVRGSRAWFRALRTSRLVVTNGRLPAWFVKRSGQYVVQTWYGSPIKKLYAHASAGTVPLYDRCLMERQVSQWDLLLAQNSAAAHDLCSALGYDGEVLVGRLPRNVGLLAGEEGRQRVRSELGVDPGARVVLYAPARRNAVMDCGGSDEEPSDFLDPVELASCTGAVVLVRGHRRIIAVRGKGGPVIDVDGYPDVEGLMLASDVLVSDYSSIVFDYALTSRPMILHVPDLGAYRDNGPGLYRGWPESSRLPLTFTQKDVGQRVREALDGAVDVPPVDPAPIQRSLGRVRAWILEALDED